MRCSVVALVLAATVAPAAAEQPTADQLFGEGRELIQRGEAQAACDKFLAAYQLDPTAPGILLNLGLCHKLLKKYGSSLRWFRKAQNAAAEAKADDYKQVAEDNTIELAALVSILKLDASRAPADTEVRIDGELIAAKDYPLFEIDAGSHQLEARARGKQPLRLTLQIGERDAQTVALVLTDAPRPVLVDTGRPRRLAAYGLGAAGLALWGVTVWYNLDLRSRFDTGELSRDAAQRNARYIGTSLFVGGVLAVAGSVALYVTAPPKHYRERTSVTPLIGGDRLGFTLTGAF